MRHGFLLIDKPAGITSHDAVAQVRRLLHEPHIGHLGTLDPAATGLLSLAVGRKALKVIELFMGLTKEYDAGVLLGSVSTTYDRDGVIEQIAPPPGWEPPEQSIVQRLCDDRFTGKISQVPPQYSAVKIGGERAYRKARQGWLVDLPARQVEVTQCRVVSYAYPRLTLHVACGSGTYIRSLAHDLGRLLRCGGYLASLRRVNVGAWSVSDAVPPAQADWKHVLPLKDVLSPLPRRDLTDAEAEALRFGRTIPGDVPPDTLGWHGGLPVAILEPASSGETHGRKVL